MGNISWYELPKGNLATNCRGVNPTMASLYCRVCHVSVRDNLSPNDPLVTHNVIYEP